MRELLAAAIELEPEQRLAFLTRESGADEALRLEVESLLASHLNSGDFLQRPAVDLAARGKPVDASVAQVGQRIGAYQIIECIGRGGMGEVYRAMRADGQYQQQVAIKLIRAGWSSGLILDRFRQERQILARFEHPNIARLLDGGATEDGTAYVVMELVDGIPIDDYCVEHALTIAERLKLFLSVCDAVQCAHSNLVVHRDLKPGNILVTRADGTVKLLDFGIAKLLEAETNEPRPDATLTAFRALTVTYASPEQIKGGLITTATDIYTLGVVLYELLTGVLPYRQSSAGAQVLASAVCELEPERPSSAARRSPAGDDRQVEARAQQRQRYRHSRSLRGDLDNIVLRCLRKEPAARYASVQQLAEDIRRHMQHLPIVARRDGFGYRCRKFVRRHRLGAAASVLMLLAAAAGIAVIVREAAIARRAQTRAERQFNDVRDLARWNLTELHDAITKLPGSSQVQNLVIQRALTYLDRLSQEATSDRTLAADVASAYEQIANLQGKVSGPGVGDTAAALQNFKKALAIRAALAAGAPNDPESLRSQATALVRYTILLASSGSIEAMADAAKRALDIGERLVHLWPRDPANVQVLARAHLVSAAALGGNGSSASLRLFPEAIAHDEAAINLLTGSHGDAAHGHPDPELFRSRIFLALHLGKARRFEDERRTWESILSTGGGLQGLRDSDQTLFYDWRKFGYERTRDYYRALSDAQSVQRIARHALDSDVHNLDAAASLAYARGTAGYLEVLLEKSPAGKKALDGAVAEVEKLLLADQARTYYKRILVLGYSYQGETLSTLHDQTSALERYGRALVYANELVVHDPGDLESQLDRVKLHTALGVVHSREGRFDLAGAEFNLGRALALEFLGKRPADAEALLVSSMLNDYLRILSGCPGRSCASAQALQIPVPLN